MSQHFCKVGKIIPDLSKLSIKEIERRISNFVDDISKVDFSNNRTINS